MLARIIAFIRALFASSGGNDVPYLDDLKNITWEPVLAHFDFKGAAREIVSQTATPLDDLLVAQFGDLLQEWFLSQFRRSPSMMAAMDAPLLSISDRRKRIEDASKAAGVTLSPTMILLLLQLAWPLVERFLERLVKRGAA